MVYELFGWAAQRYDLHTPVSHYQHDHEFVLEELRELGPSCRVLDVGCGTGVFLEKARAAGFEASGIDASPEMVTVAVQRVGPTCVAVGCMQSLDEVQVYDAVVSLSWSFNYCESMDEARDLLQRFRRALCPGGKVVLQVAHAVNTTGRLMEDRESGPHGEPDDVLFLYRFKALPDDEASLQAEYVYACHSLNELLYETHVLRAADVHRVADLANQAGFVNVTIYDSWRRDRFSRSVSPFLIAIQPRA